MSKGIRAHAFLCGLGLASACRSGPEDLLECTRPREVYDPYLHTICPEACFDDLDCPRGTLCAKLDETTNKGTCEIGVELQTSRTALLEGFGVPEMSGKLQTTEALEFVWKRPAGARYVQCALFACGPVFRTPDGAGGWFAEGDPSTAVIAGYDRCVLADELSSQPEGAFNLRERDNEFKVPEALRMTTKKDGVVCGNYGCAPITDLTVGCWAYDDTQVVAATLLAAVDVARDMYNYLGLFADADGSCEEATTGRVCRLPEPNMGTTGGAPITSTYGVCLVPEVGQVGEKECVPACTRDSDCTGPQDDPTGGGEDTVVDGWVGYCSKESVCTSLQVKGK
jgi:hypothetical protein